MMSRRYRSFWIGFVPVLLFGLYITVVAHQQQPMETSYAIGRCIGALLTASIAGGTCLALSMAMRKWGRARDLD